MCEKFILMESTNQQGISLEYLIHLSCVMLVSIFPGITLLIEHLIDVRLNKIIVLVQSH